MDEPVAVGPVGDEAAERHRTLLEINNAIISNLTRDALFRAVTRALGRVLPFERTAIFLHDAARDVLRLFVLESSLPSRYFAVGLEISPEESHMGWVFRQQRTLLRRDLATERQYQAEEWAYADGVRSFVAAPLVARGRSIGTLAVASTTPRRYTDGDAVFLRSVANQVALAIENMTAYEEIATLKARLEHENAYLQEEIHREHNFVEMVGASPVLAAVLEKVARAAATDSTVLVYGETGTGKELVARALHRGSTRRDRPLVKVNCSAISAGLVESELFGHVKGAFTGAIDRRMGRFELADGGTIFLDEVGELPLETQVKLLRVLQEQEFEPVGSSKTVRVDVRVIAATNRTLADAVAAGRFRSDLYYRLNVVPIEVPPLRERAGDIALLVAYFLSHFARKFGKPVPRVSDETMARLAAYAWPGNVRELQNVLERGLVLSRGPTLEIGADVLPGLVAEPPAAATGSPSSATTPGAVGLARMLENVERTHILGALRESGGVIEGPKGAAARLKMHPNTLRSRIAKLGLKLSGHEAS